MIDGIQIVCPIPDFPRWKMLTGLEFTTPINEDTGACKGFTYAHGTTYTHTADWRGYHILVKESRPENCANAARYTLIVKGSLHKAFYNGNNYEPFTHQQVCAEIWHLCNKLKLSPRACILQNCEIGVNIPFAIPPIQFINTHLLTYKRQAFTPYLADRAGRILGSVCKLRQYSLKVYDKGLQYSLPNNLMRIELRFTRMQVLNKLGIRTLYNLLHADAMPALGNLLLQKWKRVLIYDIEVPLESLPIPISQQRLLDCGRFAPYWVQLATQSATRYADRLKVYKSLILSFGEGTHLRIFNAISTAWQALMFAQLEPPKLIKLRTCNARKLKCEQSSLRP